MKKYKMRLRDKVRMLLTGKTSLKALKRERAFEILVEPMWREYNRLRKNRKSTKAVLAKIKQLRREAGLAGFCH